MAKNSDHSIFLVDDDIMSLTLYGQFLKSIGYEDVHLFNSGTDCIENLSLHPQIIFLDYSMEDMNGIDVLKKVRQFDPNIVVVFISGNESPEIAADAKKTRCCRFHCEILYQPRTHEKRDGRARNSCGSQAKTCQEIPVWKNEIGTGDIEDRSIFWPRISRIGTNSRQPHTTLRSQHPT